jgi:hypothetical protein
VNHLARGGFFCKINMHPLFAGLPVALVCMLFGAFAGAGRAGARPESGCSGSPDNNYHS